MNDPAQGGRSIYAQRPAELPAYADIAPSFYHVTDLPNGVTTPGLWDLRGRVDEYLGGVDLVRKRVLEIGPASGFLAVEMERRGAEVVVLDIAEDGNWDFVPFPHDVMAGVREHRFSDMKYIRNSFWYTHRAFDLKARAVYADACDIPREVGRFDIAVLAAVLLHTSNPQRILSECAEIAHTIVITEMAYPDLEQQNKALIRLHPTPENKDWGTWWHFTSAFFRQYLGVLGFGRQAVTYHSQREAWQDRQGDFFTVVASRG